MKKSKYSRLAVSVDDNASNVFGLRLECGHWRKIPFGIVPEMDNPLFLMLTREIKDGYRKHYFTCRRCKLQDKIDNIT